MIEVAQDIDAVHAERLRRIVDQYIQRRDMNNTSFAEKAGITRQRVINLRKGAIRSVTTSLLIHLARAMDRNYYDLLKEISEGTL